MLHHESPPIKGFNYTINSKVASSWMKGDFLFDLHAFRLIYGPKCRVNRNSYYLNPINKNYFSEENQFPQKRKASISCFPKEKN